MEKIALISGNGTLPYNFLNAAGALGIEIYPVALFETCDKRLLEFHRTVRINIGEITKLIEFLRNNEITKIIMLGKVEKSIIFQDIVIDKTLERIIALLPDRKDETLLFGIISFLKNSGFEILPQNYKIEEIMAKEKTYTKAEWQKDDAKSIEIGFEAAILLGKLDVGQTVVVKNKAVVSLEAVEGTDETIKRAGKYAGVGCIIVKTARPQQDMRVDVPTIGLNTVKTAVEIGAKGIVIEAEKVIFIDQKEAVELAEKNGMFIIGAKYSAFYKS